MVAGKPGMLVTACAMRDRLRDTVKVETLEMALFMLPNFTQTSRRN